MILKRRVRAEAEIVLLRQVPEPQSSVESQLAAAGQTRVGELVDVVALPRTQRQRVIGVRNPPDLKIVILVVLEGVEGRSCDVQRSVADVRSPEARPETDARPAADELGPRVETPEVGVHEVARLGILQGQHASLEGVRHLRGKLLHLGLALPAQDLGASLWLGLRRCLVLALLGAHLERRNEE